MSAAHFYHKNFHKLIRSESSRPFRELVNRLSLVTFTAGEPFEALWDLKNITCGFKHTYREEFINFGLNMLGTSNFRNISFVSHLKEIHIQFCSFEFTLDFLERLLFLGVLCFSKKSASWKSSLLRFAS